MIRNYIQSFGEISEVKFHKEQSRSKKFGFALYRSEKSVSELFKLGTVHRVQQFQVEFEKLLLKDEILGKIQSEKKSGKGKKQKQKNSSPDFQKDER